MFIKCVQNPQKYSYKEFDRSKTQASVHPIVSGRSVCYPKRFETCENLDFKFIFK